MTQNPLSFPTLAAVSQTNGRLSLKPLQLGRLPADEVQLRLVASGICHTDVAMHAAGSRVPKPVVLGHEGAGIVEAVGSAVSGFAVGDPVIASYSYCGSCASCSAGQPAYCRHTASLNFGARRSDGSTAWQGEEGPVHSHFFGQSSFSTRCHCPASNLVKVPSDLPLERLAPLGCGFQTGAGTVLNTLHTHAGHTLAVIGVGAVGLAAVMAAKLVGARRIVAMDVHADRLAWAAELGATHTVVSEGPGWVENLAACAPDGLDHVIDTSGHLETVRQVMQQMAPLGVCAWISSAKGADIPVNALHLMQGGRRIVGIHQGGSVARDFIPQLIAHHRAGRFPFERLLSFYPLERIEEAMADLAGGRVIKPVLRMAQTDAAS
jgi:aryl-alcohol dehydrogenase